MGDMEAKIYAICGQPLHTMTADELRELRDEIQSELINRGYVLSATEKPRMSKPAAVIEKTHEHEER